MAWIPPSSRKIECDSCRTKIDVVKVIPDDWISVRTFGNDGTPGVVMAEWHFCPLCSEGIISFIQTQKKP